MTTSKCSKPKNEFCRIHNPAPKASSATKPNSVAAATQKINSLFENKDVKSVVPEAEVTIEQTNCFMPYEERVSLSFADGSVSEVPQNEAEHVIGFVYKDGKRILVGKIKNPDAYYSFTPCCTESKVRSHTEYRESDNGDYEEEVFTCNMCGEEVDEAYSGFLYGVTVIPKA